LAATYAKNDLWLKMAFGHHKVVWCHFKGVVGNVVNMSNFVRVLYQLDIDGKPIRECLYIRMHIQTDRQLENSASGPTYRTGEDRNC